MSMYTLKSSLADLRREPIDPISSYEKDVLQETQILFGEKLILKDKRGEWLKVECIEQRKYYQTLWQGYEGWIKAEIDPYIPPKQNLVVISPWTKIKCQKSFPVSFGTLLSGKRQEGNEWIINLPEGEGRIDASAVSNLMNNNPIDLILLSRAEIFMGAPYLWGGRSCLSREEFPLKTSVDCSGFVNLLYRSVGIDVPRDACDQFRICKPVQTLQPGNLVFLAKASTPEKIYHVILYGGGDRLFESTMLSGTVREVTIQERFGKIDIHHGDVCGEDIVYLGHI